MGEVREDSQQRDAVVAVRRHLLVPAGDGVGRRIAPRVVVEGEEVAALVVGAAVHVRRCVVAVARHVGRRVAHGDTAEVLLGEVGLDVARRRFDVGGVVGVVVGVDDLEGS